MASSLCHVSMSSAVSTAAMIVAGCCVSGKKSQQKGKPLKSNLPLSQIDFSRKPDFAALTSGVTTESNEQQQLNGFVKTLKPGASVMAIIHGSQTGTATGFAYRLFAKGKQMGIQSIMIDPSKARRYESTGEKCSDVTDSGMNLLNDAGRSHQTLRIS